MLIDFSILVLSSNSHQNLILDPSDMSYNFQKYSHGEADYYGELYDYDSLMHYDNYAFSSNGYATIVAKSDPNKRLGQRNGFSPTDIKQLNKLYCDGGMQHKHVQTGNFQSILT